MARSAACKDKYLTCRGYEARMSAKTDVAVDLSCRCKWCGLPSVDDCAVDPVSGLCSACLRILGRYHSTEADVVGEAERAPGATEALP